MSSISGVGSVTSAENIQADYLNLLIIQLKNQNPMDPMDNSQMASQMTQLAQLEQAETQSIQLRQMSSAFDNVSSVFDQVLQNAQYAQAAGLLGKEVEFIASGTDIAGNQVSNRVSELVESVNIDDGEVTLTVGEYTIGLDDILSIRQQ